ncbi:MAG: UvrD-helicase domain-containing protein [Nocardioides sp.]
MRDFLRSRLDVALPYDEEPLVDGLPVEIDQLAQWGVGDRLLADLLAGVDPARAREQEWRRGVLPPGRLGWRTLGTLLERAVPLARAALALRTRPATAVDVDVDLGDGRWLRGTVPEVYGDRLVAVSYSRLGATHRLQSWLQVLALTAADPDRNWTAHTIGRPTNSRSRDDHAVSLLGPLDDYTARTVLGELVALRDRGLCAPLPLPLKASFGYARLRRTDATVAEAVRTAGSRLGRRAVPRRVLRPRLRAGARSSGTASGPRRAAAARRGVGRRDDPLRALALRLWAPLLTAEQELVMAASMATEPHPFDLAGPLPSGTTLLEASAGTGKTFTVTALVTRYVAEGHARLDELLVITFGRAASQELRERVRAQLVAAERALADPASADPGHQLLTLLLDADDAERAVRRRRLREALADFDGATIATTHQFCQLVLRSLGVAGDTDAGAALVESLDDLVEEVVDDLYLQRFGALAERPPFDRAAALTLAYRAIGDPQATLAATAADPASPVGARVDFAHAVRTELERRKRRLGLLSYDDLLSRLARALEPDPTTGHESPARERMRARWRIVLVDEFQDTDPVQWQVIDRAFSGHATVVLIGDPKQAIYAFRGGDVVTYLDAAGTATRQATLATNWRTDPALLDRLQVVLRQAALGDPRIVVRPVRAHHAGSRLVGVPRPAPFRVRAVSRAGFRLTRRQEIQMADARRHIAADCAGDIAELLASPAIYDGRPVAAADVAVLVATRDQGLLVHEQLAAREVPAVVAGGGHVLLTPAADEVLALLEALEQPHRSGRSARRRSRRSSGRPPPASTPAATRSPTGWPTRCEAGRCCCGRAASPRWSRPPTSRGCRRGCWPAPTASGCSPTCATWVSCCTRWRCGSGWGSPRWCTGCARSGCVTRPPPSAPAGSTATRRRCRS